MQILREILEHPDYLLLLFLRVSGLLIGSPIFGRKEVPGIAKVGFCMTLTAVFLTVLPAPAVYPTWTNLLEYGLLCLRELLFGVAMGFVMTTMDDLLEKVRQSLPRVITSRFLSGDEAGILTLDSDVEQMIAEHTRKTESGKMTILEPAQMKLLLVNTKALADQLTMEGKKTVVLTSPVIRQNFKRLIEQALPDVTVLSYTEIQQNYEIQIAGVVTTEKKAG